MSNKIKDLIISGFMSLSKVEQAILKEVVMGMDDKVSMEKPVQKDEIKLLSKKRFYEILERADAYLSEKDKARLTLLMEQRGLSDVTTFKNRTYTDMFNNADYKFKTDNGLFRFANTAHVKDLSGTNKEISFFVNTTEHPGIINHYNQLSGLKYFELDDNLRKYGYNVYEFIGAEKVNYEMVLKFRGDVKIDGIKMNIEEDEERVMTRKDLLNPNPQNTYKMDSGDFLLNG